MLKTMEMDLLLSLVRRLENCSEVLAELSTRPSINKKALAAAADLLHKIMDDLDDETDNAPAFNELAGLLVPSIPQMMEAGYTYDQAIFMYDFLQDADNPETPGELFAVVVPFMVDAYKCGRAGRELEKLYPFIKRT